MARYLKKFTRVGSIGPNEERGFGMWIGYDIVGVDEDLSEHGLIRVEDAPPGHGVTTFTPIEPERLGIQRRR
jgi:hypothetical protein